MENTIEIKEFVEIGDCYVQEGWYLSSCLVDLIKLDDQTHIATIEVYDDCNANSFSNFGPYTSGVIVFVGIGASEDAAIDDVIREMLICYERLEIEQQDRMKINDLIKYKYLIAKLTPPVED